MNPRSSSWFHTSSSESSSAAEALPPFAREPEELPVFRILPIAHADHPGDAAFDCPQQLAVVHRDEDRVAVAADAALGRDGALRQRHPHRPGVAPFQAKEHPASRLPQRVLQVQNHVDFVAPQLSKAELESPGARF
eukprot:CAMPEP_0180217398 /NCGR_PEP_ID=MMETSP0987-20121128/16925_1 /TAXON_ID=697907 /ORGANISM="non described non described, Strain CCMP2293" /LENGTH=135 /DNA_ID=CAMNT_0022176955 /DNA_START=281 /DNA_END=684 /DNA_ORIENTATION=+